MEKKIKTAKVAVIAVLETAIDTGNFLYKFQEEAKLSIPEQKKTRNKIRATLSTLCGAYLVAEKMNSQKGIQSATTALRTFVRSTYVGEIISVGTFLQMDSAKRVYYGNVVTSLKKRGVDFVK